MIGRMDSGAALAVVTVALVVGSGPGRVAGQPPAADGKFLTRPLVTHIYTADPSAHVFDGRIFIYPSHDIETGVPQDDLGSHFDMRDYHVLSMDSIGARSPTTASRSTSRACRGRAARCGRRTPPRRAASTTSTSRPRTSRTSSASASPSARGPRARSRRSRADRGQLQHRPGGVQGRRRLALHVLRRDLGRPASALGHRRSTRRRTCIRRRPAGARRPRSRACATTCSASPSL